MTPDSLADDLIQPFQVDKIGVRGRLVRLGPAVDQVLSRHDYPDAVSFILGEHLALTVALASALKFEGTFSLRAVSDGPLRMVLADFQSPGRLRGYASFDPAAVEDQVAEAGRPDLSVPALMGQGHLAWTVDQGPDTERYQGIVALEGETLAECAENYFRQSEQLDADIVLGVGRDLDSAGAWRWRAGGLMIQRLAPRGGGEADTVSQDDWDHARALVGTMTPDELVDPGIAPQQLLYRLFHEDGVWVYQPGALEARCRCSRERVEAVLRSFSDEELGEMAVADERIEVTCEFCNARYSFRSDDVR